MRATTAILILAAFLSTQGVGAGLWAVCDEGGASHTELSFARCCQTGDHDRHEAIGGSGGQQLAATECGTCVDRPFSFDTLHHAVVSDASAKSLVHVPVLALILPNHYNDQPTDLTAVLHTSPWIPAAEALRAHIDSVVLRC